MVRCGAGTWWTEWLDGHRVKSGHRFVRLHEQAYFRALHREGSRPQRQSLARRFTILRDPPLFGETLPIAAKELLKTRIAFWYLQKFR